MATRRRLRAVLLSFSVILFGLYFLTVTRQKTILLPDFVGSSHEHEPVQVPATVPADQPSQEPVTPIEHASDNPYEPDIGNPALSPQDQYVLEAEQVPW